MPSYRQSGTHPSRTDRAKNGAPTVFSRRRLGHPPRPTHRKVRDEWGTHIVSGTRLGDGPLGTRIGQTKTEDRRKVHVAFPPRIQGTLRLSSLPVPTFHSQA